MANWISEIIRASRLTSYYQYSHFEVAPDGWDFMRTTTATAVPQDVAMAAGNAGLGRLIGMPVRVIYALAPMRWRVVQTVPAHFTYPDLERVPACTTVVGEGSLSAPGL